ncbi:hypothetical protein [Actinoplanes palleronii]|uniref:Uncharacterized protein n=1 Tax=Actinoplanes palleronii TaxID=113570 RepID=A0ABQ4BLY9_9ACTN|nr:hypothetical protein [Actinoplanes palleronii]GIE71692.1 hypothetical protein Apa02nite_078000 [Actinoplanes palleronii]
MPRTVVAGTAIAAEHEHIHVLANTAGLVSCSPTCCWTACGPPPHRRPHLVWLATAPEALLPGAHVASRSPFTATTRSTYPTRAQRLWQSSLTAVASPTAEIQ